MPFALVPDGFELKKVTKLQKDAVDKYYRHENVKALIDNPEIIKQLIITGVAFLVAREGKDALTELKKLGASIPKTVEDAFTEKRTFGTSAPVGVSFEDLVDEAFVRLGLKSE
jgi:DNA phosphorothioation-dependent restriction protein DptG